MGLFMCAVLNALISFFVLSDLRCWRDHNVYARAFLLSLLACSGVGWWFIFN